VEEVVVTVNESRAAQRREARARIYRALRDGSLPGLDDIARARGLVVRERRHSIFSDSWPILALFFILIGLIANRNPAMLALGSGLFVIVGISAFWRHFALSGVTYERDYERTHAFPGEAVRLTLTISNRKPLPVTWLQFKDQLPVAPEGADDLTVAASLAGGGHQLVNTVSLGPYEKIRRATTIRLPRRGFYQIGPVEYLAGDVFALFTVERRHSYHDTVVIYPRVWPLQALSIPARELLGELRVRRSLFTDPVCTRGIRHYQPQDRFRDVHWKASARRGELQTKVYDPASGMSVVVFLNVATFPRHWMGYTPKLLERAISVTASIAKFAVEQRWSVGVCANGSVPGSDQPIRVPPGRSPDQLLRMLEALAAVTPFATGSVELLMHRESARLPWASSLILVTALITPEMVEALNRLRGAGRRVVLVSLAQEPPPGVGPRIPVFHSPPDAPAFQKGRSPYTATEASLNAVPTPEDIVSAVPLPATDD
jgi:uncharacterized protein (DUF58 family)